MDFGRIREFSVRVRKRRTTAGFQLIISPLNPRGIFLPYRYDSCDVGTLPNQTMNGEPAIALTSGNSEDFNFELSYMPGQRLSRCTCVSNFLYLKVLQPTLEADVLLDSSADRRDPPWTKYEPSLLSPSSLSDLVF